MKDSFWIEGRPLPDTYVLFRGSFRLEYGGRIRLRTVGASWYQGWVDGRSILEGPLRYALDHPEYQTDSVDLPAGNHVLAFHCHYAGIDTRVLKDTPPFLWCQVLSSSEIVSVEWKCLALESQRSCTRRLNSQLGWTEWRDTRLEPTDWQSLDYGTEGWTRPRRGASDLPEPHAADLGSVHTFVHQLAPLGEGPLATRFGYAPDEPAWTFHSRDRVCQELPIKGRWRRYDLGRIRLGRPSLTIDVPEGTVLEMAYSEELVEGRVSPFINLSASSSCNLDRYIARGGPQTFCPLAPRGGRFLEVHIVNSRQAIFLEERYLERAYHPPTDAKFTCGDPLLERIWAVGVETYRSCAEDAIIDNVTRERGQWVGDVASAGLEIAALAYHDLRLCKRALIQAAYCPREDGLVAGMSPGGCIYLPTYAFQWAVAVLSYYRHTGDRGVLVELWPSALRSMAAIEAFLHEDGLHNVAGWNFVDWGYEPDDGPVDTACNLYYCWSLRAMREWAILLGKSTDPWDELWGRLKPSLITRIDQVLLHEGWPGLGYHCAALALRLGFIADEGSCLEFLKNHLLSCFPNNRDAPRNDDPESLCSQLITPYFAHYVMPLLLERNEADFVLQQFRQCWGWMLEGGRTTLLEVFDTRWSHGHQWSGCPSWQLSRYVLGLHPRFDLSIGTFDFFLAKGSLPFAAGRIPHPEGGWIEVEWKMQDCAILYSLRSDARLSIRFRSDHTIVVEAAYSVLLHPDGSFLGIDLKSDSSLSHSLVSQFERSIPAQL